MYMIFSQDAQVQPVPQFKSRCAPTFLLREATSRPLGNRFIYKAITLMKEKALSLVIGSQLSASLAQKTCSLSKFICSALSN